MAPVRTKSRKYRKINPRKSLSKKISKIVERKAETKVVTTQYEGGATANNWCTNLPVVEYISGIACGNTSTTRTGYTITPKELLIKGLVRFYVNAGNAATYWGNPVRVVVFSYDCSQDASAVSAIPGFSEVIDSNPSTGTTQPPDYINRPYDNPNRLAYTILYDKTFANNGQGLNYTPFTIRISGKKLPKVITYNGDTASSANASRNGLFIMYMSMFDKVTSGETEVTGALFSYVSTLKFKDI